MDVWITPDKVLIMNIIVGRVVDTRDNINSGEFMAEFPVLENRTVAVTYTSPYYKANSGGLIALPEEGTEILALHNENPNDGESTFYFHSCVVKDKRGSSGEEEKKEFEPVRDNDSKAKVYGSRDKPVTQTFTNTAGAGLFIHRDFSPSKISNNVTIKAETGAEVNVGALGVQIKNEEGDSFVLNGEANEFFAARSMSIETQGPQEYKCTNSDINMRVVEGGDINIENNSTGVASFGDKWSGNIRLKSRNKNVELVGLGDESVVNIITNKAKIQVDNNTGNISIYTTEGDLNLTSKTGNVNIEAPLGDFNVYALNSVIGSTIKSDILGNFVAIGGNTLSPVGSYFPVFQQPAGTPTVPENTPWIPFPAVVPLNNPEPDANEYNDGLAGPGAL